MTAIPYFNDEVSAKARGKNVAEARIEPPTPKLGGEYGNHSATSTGYHKIENYATCTAWKIKDMAMLRASLSNL